jgi:hypothetical protein
MSEGVLSWAGEATGGGRGEGAPPVVIGEVGGPLRAGLARSYLESAGLTVFLDGEAMASTFGLAGGPLATVRVLVPAAQAEEGARLFAEFEAGAKGGDRMPA